MFSRGTVGASLQPHTAAAPRSKAQRRLTRWFIRMFSPGFSLIPDCNPLITGYEKCSAIRSSPEISLGFAAAQVEDIPSRKYTISLHQRDNEQNAQDSVFDTDRLGRNCRSSICRPRHLKRLHARVDKDPARVGGKIQGDTRSRTNAGSNETPLRTAASCRITLRQAERRMDSRSVQVVWMADNYRRVRCSLPNPERKSPR